MSKSSKTILIIFLVVVIIGGAFYAINMSNKPQDDNVQKEPINTEEPNNTDIEENNKDDIKDEGETITIAENKIDIQKLTLLSKTEVDIDEDGQQESIEMYTAAQKDEKGNIMWDDGQNWSLIVKDGDNEYHLFNDYVQIGEIRYWVYTSAENNEFHITTIMPTTARLLISNYVFDKDSRNFYKTTVFNAENVNMLGSSQNFRGILN